ncbi:diphthamide biosynthesis protein [Coccomyxa subellipsoidea C-169]|uniref:Diphthamide biosynthesis protein n=1 Tax=Coccomyxa subellipsoidea (strain C-169) TaxID=574566 RepID=I0YZH7_COCSC|nr:diphthamide biosynthesis protein [Coccomyxa subellipsoidea C-169]EIE23796.1 diphthamide biosynthesis protein [Coccomyxa subellipsoidea C-169]|eukprot:XP_005648340.1 diphthamide biosynthesis protein [Coccomyxa subellipsoidea C-169]
MDLCEHPSASVSNDKDSKGDAWAQFWDIQGVAAYITARKFTVVTLQFPDDLLREAKDVSKAVQDICARHGLQVKTFVLADTTYNSLGVDEVAAQHVHAQCVIHYGRASLSPLSTLPAYFVFTRAPLDCSRTAERLVSWAAGNGSAAVAGMKAVVVLSDQPLLWAVNQLRACLASSATKANLDVQFLVADILTHQLAPVPSSSPQPATSDSQPLDTDTQSHRAPAEGSRAGHWVAAGLQWDLPEGVDAQDCLWLWLGDDDAPALTQLLMTYSRMHWAMYNPQEDSLREGLPSEISRTLRKRNYLIEKAKNANIIGIVVGTLGVAGYLEAAEAIKKLAQAAGKKTYTLLMGKPSPVKLANFPEVDVFVLIADAQGQILESKEFYSPLITPYEAQLAFAPEGGLVSNDYRLDFDALLSSTAELSVSEREAAPRFSLVDGGRYGSAVDRSVAAASTALAERNPHVLHMPEGPGRLAEVRSAAEYLVTRRTFTGLETPFTGAAAKPVVKAIVGRSGRAAQYEDETLNNNRDQL